MVIYSETSLWPLALKEKLNRLDHPIQITSIQQLYQIAKPGPIESMRDMDHFWEWAEIAVGYQLDLEEQKFVRCYSPVPLVCIKDHDENSLTSIHAALRIML